RGLVADVRFGRFTPALPARRLALCASPAGGRAGGSIVERAASGTAPIVLRGVARASIVAQVAATAHPERPRLAAGVERRAQGGLAGHAAVQIDSRATTSAGRDRARPQAGQTHAAPGAGR